MNQCPLQRKVGPGLDRRQRIQPKGAGPSSEQIDPASTQTARTGPGQNEAKTRRFDQPMHFVEDCPP